MINTSMESNSIKQLPYKKDIKWKRKNSREIHGLSQNLNDVAEGAAESQASLGGRVFHHTRVRSVLSADSEMDVVGESAGCGHEVMCKEMRIGARIQAIHVD